MSSAVLSDVHKVYQDGCLEAFRFAVKQGDTVCIRPGMPHRVQNTSDRPLKILCCCTPPYADDDTELLDD